MRSTVPSLALTLCALGLGLTSPVSARAEMSSDLTGEIARLRGRLADNSAQEQHCLVGAGRPVWTAALATDLKTLQDRANQAAADGASADAQRWKELARKAEVLQTQVMANARTGVELVQSQQAGLDCLDRYAEEREALRASLELALADPATYRESLRLAGESGAQTLRQDLGILAERARSLSMRWKESRAESSVEAGSLKAGLDGLRRRHVVALESAPVRSMADPVLRAVEALLAAALAWERERSAEARAAATRDAAERRLALRERDEAGRLARGYLTTAERLIAGRGEAGETTRTGTASPGAGGTP